MSARAVLGLTVGQGTVGHPAMLAPTTGAVGGGV